MSFRTKRRHMIDFLFPVALFFVFALSALTLILLAARIYRSTTENSSRNYTSRTGLSYISEKIHQSDEGGRIYPGEFEGCEALIIEQTYREKIYRTYIYAFDGSLRELFVRDGTYAKASDGNSLLEIHDFSIEQITDDLLKFDCTDSMDRRASALIAIRSVAQ
ncbi:MAG TPA: DUF4860 domain-containing protein [Lachnospiraceae bacterium]|nr:DUF4860 domain-containing protein [Lachnospiraceae bacterium]